LSHTHNGELNTNVFRGQTIFHSLSLSSFSSEVFYGGGREQEQADIKLTASRHQADSKPTSSRHQQADSKPTSS